MFQDPDRINIKPIKPPGLLLKFTSRVVSIQENFKIQTGSDSDQN